LVNNAAIQVNKTVEDTTFEEWNKQLSINLGGVFLCSKYFLPHLRKTKGNIVNMSSVNGFFVETLLRWLLCNKGRYYCAYKSNGD
jgi:NAD(P)-dependent dehydrogenase (short-subunit alcohol dehydrogenase family)